MPGDPLYPPGAPRGDTLTPHAAGASGVPGSGCRRQSSLDAGHSVLRSLPSGVGGGDGQLLFLTLPLGDCSVLAGTALPRSWAPSRGRPITCVTPPPLWSISWFSVFHFGEREAMTLLVGGSFCVGGPQGDPGSGSVCPLCSAEVTWILHPCRGRARQTRRH